MIATVPNLLTSIAAVLKSAMPDLDIRVQLDPFDVDAFMDRESFRDVAARVVFGEATPVRRAGGGYDLGVGLGVFFAAMRSGRPDPAKASADLDCMARAAIAWQAIAAEPYVGLTRMGQIDLRPLRVLASELTNAKGFALVAIELGTTLHDAFSGPAGINRLTGVDTETWLTWTLNGSQEQPIPEPP